MREEDIVYSEEHNGWNEMARIDGNRDHKSSMYVQDKHAHKDTCTEFQRPYLESILFALVQLITLRHQ